MSTIFCKPAVWDPIPPYKYEIIRIYKLLLKRGESVVSCGPLIYSGEHIFNMYDLEITQLNEPNPPRYIDSGEIAPASIRLSSRAKEDWHNSRWPDETK